MALAAQNKNSPSPRPQDKSISMQSASGKYAQMALATQNVDQPENIAMKYGSRHSSRSRERPETF